MLQTARDSLSPLRAGIDAIPLWLTLHVSLTHAAQRRQRKRRIVRTAAGGVTTSRRAQYYIESGRAWLNEQGELEFDPAHPQNQRVALTLAPAPFLPGYQFEWRAGISGGVKVMKARGHQSQ